MKHLNIIIFANDNEIQKHSESVVEKLSGYSSEKEFLGIWGEILFNREEVSSAISSTVNWFLGSEKQTVFFGCCEKDYSEIILRIEADKCKINVIPYKDFEGKDK